MRQVQPIASSCRAFRCETTSESNDCSRLPGTPRRIRTSNLLFNRELHYRCARGVWILGSGQT
ncbi:MAG: hypothetical protein JWO59_208 [Chloroflexi bacterium]|nr:hypothetical protein [Chloroflexota bacterium]